MPVKLLDTLIIHYSLREIKKYPGHFRLIRFNQNALLLVKDVETRWNLTYLMLKRLEKLKFIVHSCVANKNNFKPENFLTADE